MYVFWAKVFKTEEKNLSFDSGLHSFQFILEIPLHGWQDKVVIKEYRVMYVYSSSKCYLWYTENWMVFATSKFFNMP